MEIPIILWQPVEGLFMYPTFLVVPESTLKIIFFWNRMRKVTQTGNDMRTKIVRNQWGLTTTFFTRQPKLQNPKSKPQKSKIQHPKFQTPKSKLKKKYPESKLPNNEWTFLCAYPRNISEIIFWMENRLNPSKIKWKKDEESISTILKYSTGLKKLSSCNPPKSFPSSNWRNESWPPELMKAKIAIFENEMAKLILKVTGPQNQFTKVTCLFAGEETVEVELTNPRQATLDFQLPNA